MNRLPAYTPPPFVAVAGLSARMLAQSARRAGLRVAALDAFGDRDTRAAAELWFDIGADGLAISRDRLIDALRRVARLPRVLGWIDGSGLEPLVGELATTRGLPPLIGNRAYATGAVRDPRRLAALLDALGIAHPAVRFTRPVSADDARGWLRKLADGCGGTHVEDAARHLADPAPPAGTYFQRWHPGTPMSALFVAAGGRAAIVGFAEQWTDAFGPLRFVHAGAIGPVAVPERVARALAEALDAICARTGLVGVNSCDFLLDDENFAVLEINTRPSATLALHEAAHPRAWPRGLVAAHLDACLHARLPLRVVPASFHTGVRCAAQRVLFAPHAFVVSAAFSDACCADPGCRDVPPAGTPVEPGQPVCTLFATAPAPDAARRMLDAQRRVVLERIGALCYAHYVRRPYHDCHDRLEPDHVPLR